LNKHSFEPAARVPLQIEFKATQLIHSIRSRWLIAFGSLALKWGDITTWPQFNYFIREKGA